MNHMVQLAATSLGWVGAVGTVGAYGLVSRRRLDAGSVRFQLVNVVGGGLLAVSALSVGSWPSVVSNLVWMSIGLHGLLDARHVLAATAVERWRATLARHDVPHIDAAASGNAVEPVASQDEIALAA